MTPRWTDTTPHDRPRLTERAPPPPTALSTVLLLLALLLLSAIAG